MRSQPDSQGDFFSALLGRLSDRYGRRPILLLSSLGTLVGFLILGFANSLWLLFAGRILDGLTGGNISVAQAYITDVTDEKERAKGLGMVGAAFGLGFIIGPLLGGALSSGGRYALPSFVAAGITLVNVLAIYFWLPESLTEEDRKRVDKKSRKTIDPRELLEALRRPVFGPCCRPVSFTALPGPSSPRPLASLPYTVWVWSQTRPATFWATSGSWWSWCRGSLSAG